MTAVADRTPPMSLAQQQHAIRKAQRFFWTFLMLATAASVGGNISHAILNPERRYPALVAAAVFTAAPVVLLLVTHGASLLAHLPRQARSHHWVNVVFGVLIGAGAFALSFDSQRDLALNCGVRPSMTWIFALIVDLGIAAATYALFWLARLRLAAALDELPHTDNESTAPTQPNNPPAGDRPAQPAAAPAVATPDPGHDDDEDEDVALIECDSCSMIEVANEEHPAQSAEARRRRGWTFEGRGRDRRDYCPTCTPTSRDVTVTKRDRPMAAVPSGTSRDGAKSA